MAYRLTLLKLRAFTLIEMSIVLVIIGLIVGGILVGQNLVKAAEVRATITQEERYNQATNTFKGKYNELPGDITAAAVTQLGFATVPVRAGTQGRGDGNGLLEGFDYTAPAVVDWIGTGEPFFFWEDLSANSHLIEGSFQTAAEAQLPTNVNTATLYEPPAKIGRGNFFYVYSRNGRNFFGLSAVTNIYANGHPYSSTGLTVNEAYSIDTKIDDGLPQSGNVLAFMLNGSNGWFWAGGGGNQGAYSGLGSNPGPTNAATVGSPTTCYDNSASSSGTPGVAGATQHYSLEIGNGSNVNCGLSFSFQ